MIVAAQRYRVECDNCGGAGEIEGDCDCMESVCCCLDPNPPPCRHCGGRGFLVVSELTDDNCENAIPIVGEP